MPKVIVDIGYWAWNRAYPIFMNPDSGFDAFNILYGFADFPTTIFACDSSWSQRKTNLPWYKSKRDNPYESTAKMRIVAEQLIHQLKEMWPERCLTIPGYEADDVIAIHAEEGDFVYGNDKDLLTIQKDFHLWNFDFTPFDCKRFKAPYELRRGNSALAWQLLKGDTADDIPSLWRGTPPQSIFTSNNPLKAAIDLINNTKVVAQHLLALSLPCPLYKTKLDVISKVLEDHPAYEETA